MHSGFTTRREKELAEGVIELERKLFEAIKVHCAPSKAALAREVIRLPVLDDFAKPCVPVPVVPPIQDQGPVDPNPVVAKCGACGMDWRQTMHYVCGRGDCPMQTRVTC